ncbi:hypothetical protein Arub01_38410 [Actinomadura rubrobrunea]|uniref:Peptide chain release factor 1 n=1 Tax=Actinomadura rubrobrunea TaxID=115335 RepID=A0A9W6UXU1_9ACTN|nr:Vms1/Ankzf1 family peptidyl-tRNA hydrolase [Actinomadura rubrobrunea]GLW65597.1 hypothetical protein Arub01_38410 [Actinomadura rubrobrunea]
MDLTFLKPLYRRSGPYVSVYVDLTRTTEDVSKAAELRWRALRAHLEEQGAPRDTLRAVEETVLDDLHARRSAGMAIFAADGEVALAERLPGPPAVSLARMAPLPHVLPCLAARGERLPYVRVLVDRRGGEICCVTADGRRRVIEVEGDEEYPIRKTKAGDWNQSRFQRAAAMAWKANAKKVGREVDHAAERCGAEAVVIAGDVQARGAVLEEISERLRGRTVEADRGSRADGADGAALDAEIRRILDLKRTERVGAVAERFERELAHGQRAVAGLPATVQALRRGQVECLLLDDDPFSPARLWVGPRPGDLALTADELRESGVDDPVQDRADAALIRAAACADGELFIVPPDEPYAGLGVGAVLRYTIAA